jgi:hypothetical protein
MKVGTIELAEWETDGYARMWRGKTGLLWEGFTYPYTEAAIFLNARSEIWVSIFYGELEFCNNLFRKEWQHIDQGVREMDQFLIRIDKIMAFQ